jgi:hypothetical protein
MFEPITLPRAKSGKPFTAELILTMSSGAEVAKETTVIPIIIFGIFKPKEIDTADFNSQFPPKINKIKPISIKKKLMFYFLNEDTFLYVSCIQKDGFDQKIGFRRCLKKNDPKKPLFYYIIEYLIVK